MVLYGGGFWDDRGIIGCGFEKEAGFEGFLGGRIAVAEFLDVGVRELFYSHEVITINF